MKIKLLGTAYPYRGGLALYNERLMEEFHNQSHQVSIDTFSLQYPSFLFPGKTQFASWEKPSIFPIKRLINSVNPINWILQGLRIRRERPDILIIKYWLPFMSPCFSTIARIAKMNNHTKVICIVDNIIPHEKRFLDNLFTRYFVPCVDGFIAMSQSVLDDISIFDKNKPRTLSPHPLFDNFGEALPKKEALDSLELRGEDINLLFFGLVREYKGLDLLLEALSDQRLREFPIKLLVAGEFYEDPEPYYEKIRRLGLEDMVKIHAKFIPDDEVKQYFSSADLVVLPYKTATQSGVTQIGYHFSKPMLVTNVGGLAEIIPNRICGYVAEPNPASIADSILEFCSQRPDFSQNIEIQKKKYSWQGMTQAIQELISKIK